MTTTEFEKYLKSIGGLENGFYTDRPVIVSRHFCNVRDGWLQLIHDCIAELLEANWNKHILQIKEKFGGLRFYIGSGSEEIFNIIIKYEELSWTTCEVCGEQGILRNDCGWQGNKWYKTLCDTHYQDLIIERRQDI